MGAAPAVEQGRYPAGTREPVPDQGQDQLDEAMAAPLPNTGRGDLEQGTSDSDRSMTQRIRRALLRDESLSFTAKNILIVTRAGNVTLRGFVLSEKEHQLIDQLVRSYVGDGTVTDLLELKGHPSLPPSDQSLEP
jgi:osmotically-inducible protein OsmY